MHEPLDVEIRIGSPDGDHEDVDAFTRDLLRELRDMPAVEEAGLAPAGAAGPRRSQRR